jgi:hypothetical protein
MDDLEKKFFLQFDDPMPGQRANALELWRERNLKLDPPRTFRDVVHEFESAIPKAKVEALEKELADYKTWNTQGKQANDTLTQENAKLRREVANLKALNAIRVNWKKIAAGVAVVALLGGAYYWWGPGAAAAEERERVNAFYRASLEKTTWQEGERGPLVGMIAGKPYWMMVRGETEETHVDNQGRPVVLQCSRVCPGKSGLHRTCMGLSPVKGLSIPWSLGFAESSLFGAGRPFFVPSPAIRFPERAEGVKGPKR